MTLALQPNRAARRRAALHGEVLTDFVHGTIDATPTRAGETQAMRWVPDEDIPADHRAFVREHVDRVADELGLPHVTVRYFEPTDDAGDFAFPAGAHDAIAAGVTPPGDVARMTIGLPASLRGDFLLAAIAHEVRHLYQPTEILRLHESHRRLLELIAPLAKQADAIHEQVIALLDDNEPDAHAFASAYVRRQLGTGER